MQVALIRPTVRRLGDRATFMLGVACAAAGLVAAALAQSVVMFVGSLVPLAIGIGLGHPTVLSLVSRAARGEEQGRVQGAASALESLGRTVGPVWGNASLQHWGVGVPYYSAAGFLLLTLLMSVGYRVADSGGAPMESPT